jgi:hypothetical protein
MASTTNTAKKLSSRRRGSGLVAELADLVQNLAKALFDPYRPELHYMRGPGPKWHSKHDRASLALSAAVAPALIPVRIKR